MYHKIRTRRVLKYITVFIVLSFIFTPFLYGQVSYAATTNHPPVIVASERISKQTVTLGQSDLVLDLSKLFNDEDGDVLTYNAVPVIAGIVSTQINSDQLSIKTLAPGITRIKVSADDGKLGRANSSFEIEVLPAVNSSPVVAQIIANQTTTDGGSNVTVDASGVFTDVDNDALALSVSSSHTSVATVSVSGTTISIISGTAGTSTITVTAEDGNGGSVTTTFTVTVTTASTNHDPVVSQTIGNQRGNVGGTSWSIDASGTFTDADSDTLALSVSSSHTSVATVSVSGTTISITPGTVGTSTITVTADDGNGGSHSTSFTVTIDIPALFITDFIQGGNGRNVLELFNPTASSVSGYKLEIHQYNTVTKQHSSGTLDVSLVSENMSFIVIDPIFYDFFDITSANYYNDEYSFFRNASTSTVAIALKYNGLVVDMLGDPNSTTAILPNDGGYIRKTRIKSGALTFDISEWELLTVNDFHTVGRY